MTPIEARKILSEALQALADEWDSCACPEPRTSSCCEARKYLTTAAEALATLTRAAKLRPVRLVNTEHSYRLMRTTDHRGYLCESCVQIHHAPAQPALMMLPDRIPVLCPDGITRWYTDTGDRKLGPIRCPSCGVHTTL